MGLANIMAKVSVMIPTHNYGRYLGEAIQSVLAQTFADIEVIVVDDGSTDNTREVVGSFKDSRVRYIYQENRGVSAAQNTAIKAAEGEFVAGLGGDDIWLPEKLELELSMLNSHPEAALVCSDAYVFDSATGAILGRRWHDKPFHYWVDPARAARQPLRELLARGCFIAPQAMLVRRVVFAEVGYFDESLVTHEDWDLFVRIVCRYPINTLDVPLVKIRAHEASLTADWNRMYRGATTVLTKAIDSQLLSGAEMMLVKRRLAHTHFSYGKSLLANGRTALGREKLVAAIKINPWPIRPYVFLAGSLLGDRTVLAVKSWKDLLEHREVR